MKHLNTKRKSKLFIAGIAATLLLLTGIAASGAMAQIPVNVTIPAGCSSGNSFAQVCWEETNTGDKHQFQAVDIQGYESNQVENIKLSNGWYMAITLDMPNKFVNPYSYQDEEAEYERWHTANYGKLVDLECEFEGESKQRYSEGRANQYIYFGNCVEQ